jgi:transitional endoplasmic reticulum ATPase
MPLSSNVNLQKIADMANGYVGADLASLCRESAIMALERKSNLIEMEDFIQCLSKINPSTTREFSIKIQNLDWSSIGGLENVKQKLKRSVEWPIAHKDTFQRFHLRAPRGILLYGPPGCCKTTLVKVVASTSKASFFSLSGASVYSAYVGEAEEMVRNVFKKARMSSPSIIFFDEIDALVGKRQFGQVCLFCFVLFCFVFIIR